MSPRNVQPACDRAMESLLVGCASKADSDFLNVHLAECDSCSERSIAIHHARIEMRSEAVYADPAMVRATQLRVRARAEDFRRQRESMRPLWISSVLALGWAVLSMPLLWQGFSWLGHTTKLPDVIWQSAFAIMALTPITAVGIIGAAGRFQIKVAS